MLNLKKVIALVCVFALALTTVAFGATYSDVAEDSAYYEAVETLNKLDIITGYEDGTFKPEDSVTRAEMAALIARIQGYGETAAGSANTGFTDVPATHWASGFIANAAGMGIINGYGDGTFGPEDPVLYEQAVKMVMATLGYTPFAEKNGGYPTGYLAAAQRYDVSLAVANAVQGTNANRGTIAQILENALDTPLMIQSQWNTNGEVTYIIADGSVNSWGQKVGYKTLMSENLGYVKIRGIVRETPVTEIGYTKDINTNEEEKVRISVVDDYDTENKLFLDRATNEFLVNGTDAADYLGRSVIAYLKANSKDSFEILSVAVDTNRNEELTIGLDQFVGYVDGDKVAYLKEGASQATKVLIETPSWVEDEEDEEDGGYYVGGMEIIYNFDGGVEANLEELVNKLYGGSITFIDNDDVKGYDIAIVEQAATAVVDEVEDGYVAFKDPAVLGWDESEVDGLLIEEDDETKIVQVQKDGEVIDIAELAEWDVLSILAATNESDVIVAEVVTNQVIGTIASTKKSKTSADDTGYSIDGTWYDVAATCAGDALKIGLGGTFYIDKYGKIAAFNEDSALAGGAVANYGYVLGTAVDSETTFGSAVVKVQMLTADGVVVMEVKNNARLNDEVIYTTGNDHYDEEGDPTACDEGCVCAEAAADAIPVGTIVKYTKNASEALSTIVTAGATDDFEGEMFEEAISAEFEAENSKLDGAGYLDADAKVFAIGGAIEDTTTDAKDSKMLTVADFEDKNDYTVLGIFATDKADDNDMVVVAVEGFTAAGATSGLAVVTGVSETSNDEGEEVWGITYYVNGEEVEGLTDAETAEGTMPTIGDVVKVKATNGLITSIKFVANFTEDIRNANGTMAAVTSNYVSTTEDEVFGKGTATAYKKSSSQITLGEDGTFKLLSDANKYVVDFTAADDIVIGTTGSYKYFENIFKDIDDVETDYSYKLKKNGSTLTGTFTADEALARTDYVVVREYDGRVTDVVIIRGIDSVTRDAEIVEEGGEEGEIEA